MGDSKFNSIKDTLELEEVSHKISDSALFNRLLDTLSKESYCLEKELGLSASRTVTLVRNLWPDKPNTSIKVRLYLLSKYGLKYCSSCKLVKMGDEFSLSKSRPTGLNTHCKDCYKENTRGYQREYQKTRKLLKLHRVPAWADKQKIKEIYSKCPEGYRVDHIVPLQGELVSGLHVETSLQYLLAKDTLKKHNSFLIE